MKKVYFEVLNSILEKNDQKKKFFEFLLIRCSVFEGVFLGILYRKYLNGISLTPGRKPQRSLFYWDTFYRLLKIFEGLYSCLICHPLP